MNIKQSKLIHAGLLLVILILAAFFRLYGLNWDQNQHLHPDERFLTMVANDSEIPASFWEYLDPQISPLNPYNGNYSFFVYGTFPVTFTKLAAEKIKFENYDYNNITLVGRLISAFFDLGALLLVFLIARKIFNSATGLVAAFLYALYVLPIQLSHFFASDTFLVFFITLALYFLINFYYQPSIGKGFGLGLAIGLGLACKISAALILPVIALGFLLTLIKRKKFILIFVSGLLFMFSAYLVLKIGDPKFFAQVDFLHPVINPQFIANLKELRSFDDPNGYFPPAIQWMSTKPLIFPLKNMILWGLGLPLGILAFFGLLFSPYEIIKKKNLALILVVFWVLLLFTYQGIQFSKTIRYFYPVYSSLAILTAGLFYQIFATFKSKDKIKTILMLSFLFIPFLVFWPISFMAIYSRPHSRITASRWIFENIPAGSTISCEHWDDCLPIGLSGFSSSLYQTETLPLFNQDTPEKWSEVNQQLEKIDYLIMSSNRLWGSIPKVPEKYPLTSRFYQDLFAHRLNFRKAAEITSYPTIPFLNIPISDDAADESFTVYDHPKVLIFKKSNLDQIKQ